MPSVDELEKEVERLHGMCESKGMNSRGTTDIFGRKFSVPVNSEHKATVFFPILWTGKQPHMRTFWAATIGFFCTFFSCFAPGAIGSYIRRAPPEGLGLEREQLVLAGNLAVTGTILMRVISGPMCDKIGARKTFIFLLMLGVPGMIMLVLRGSPFLQQQPRKERYCQCWRLDQVQRHRRSQPHQQDHWRAEALNRSSLRQACDHGLVREQVRRSGQA